MRKTKIQKRYEKLRQMSLLQNLKILSLRKKTDKQIDEFLKTKEQELSLKNVVRNPLN